MGRQLPIPRQLQLTGGWGALGVTKSKRRDKEEQDSGGGKEDDNKLETADMLHGLFFLFYCQMVQQEKIQETKFNPRHEPAFKQWTLMSMRLV